MILVIQDADLRTYRHVVKCPACPVRMGEIVEAASMEHAEAHLYDGFEKVASCLRDGRPWLKLPGSNA